MFNLDDIRKDGNYVVGRGREEQVAILDFLEENGCTWRSGEVFVPFDRDGYENVIFTLGFTYGDGTGDAPDIISGDLHTDITAEKYGKEIEVDFTKGDN